MAITKKGQMHIHWFQHDNFEDLACIGQWAEKRGHFTSVTRYDINPKPPDLDTVDWLIVMGGKMGVNDETSYPWLIDEKEYIQRAVKKGKVVIGICLGAQLVAASLGAQVTTNNQPEMGFFPIHFSETAGHDDVFKHFPKELTVLHFHNDTFELPKGAILMASSQATTNQAFRYEKNVFAFQFHFEVTPGYLPLFFKDTEINSSKDQYIQDFKTIIESASVCTSNNLIFEEVLDTIALL